MRRPCELKAFSQELIPPKLSQKAQWIVAQSIDFSVNYVSESKESPGSFEIKTWAP